MESSQWTVAAMDSSVSSALLWFSRKSPSAVFAMIWAVILLGWILDSIGLSPIIRSVGAAISTMILFGYPFLLIFGLPAKYSTKAERRLSILSVCVLGLICIASLILNPSAPENQITDSWIKLVIGIPIDVLVFAPFFVATHILGQARRSLGVYRPLDSIGAWVSLFFFAFGGVFFLHRNVATAVQSLAELGQMSTYIGQRDTV
jgi:hypothetical protein